MPQISNALLPMELGLNPLTFLWFGLRLLVLVLVVVQGVGTVQTEKVVVVLVGVAELWLGAVFLPPHYHPP